MGSLEGSAFAGKGRTALVVEDEHLTRMMVADALNDCGYTVLEAEGGPTAHPILQSSVRIDLLITDYHLPGGFKGSDLVAAARRARPDLTILLISGLPEAVIRRDDALPPDTRLLAKPFTMMKLLNTIALI